MAAVTSLGEVHMCSQRHPGEHVSISLFLSTKPPLKNRCIQEPCHRTVIRYSVRIKQTPKPISDFSIYYNNIN